MLAIGFKVSDTPLPSVQNPLKTFLEREYAPAGVGLATEQQQALEQFMQLKSDVDLVRTPSTIARHVLLRYYAQLDRVAARFPCDAAATDTKASGLRLQFTWNDSFCPRKKITQASVRFEQACVMFNYGALESQLGVQTDRSTAEGLKTACRHFMHAAGAFTLVKDELVDQCLGTRTPDMSVEGLGMLIALMLAQAQACFYEKAIKDQMKDAIKAKLVHHALELYTSALELCQSSALHGTIDRMWSIHILFQVFCMKAATQYWQAKAVKELALSRGVGYGEEIARLVAAETECQEAIKVATQNKLPATLAQSIKTLQRVIAEQLQVARKDNASVYLENVPKWSDLPVVGKASMVKALVLTPDEITQELNGVDLFEQFVPNTLLQQAAEAKESVQTLVIKATERVSASNEYVKERLHTMGLPASIEAFEKTSDNGIPSSIWSKIDHIQTTYHREPLGQVLEGRLKENDASSERAERVLHEIELKLADEEREDNACRQNYGVTRWPRPVSASLSMGFRADIDRYYRLVRDARQSDVVVQSKLDANGALLALLGESKASLDAQLPPLEHENSSCRSEIAEVSRLLLELTALMEEKDQVLRDFNASYDKFQALPALLRTHNTSVERSASSDVLASELQFFQDHFVAKIESICGEENTLVGHLVVANKQFEAKKASDAVMHARQAFLQRLSDAVDVLEQLQSHLKEGAKFYDDLHARIQQLSQTVDDHCSARDLERREMELNVAADEEMRKREAQDAAVAEQMMREMNLRGAANDQQARDEALARQLAANTPQYFQPTTTQATTLPQQGAATTYDFARLPPQQQPPSGYAYGQTHTQTPPPPPQSHPYALHQQAPPQQHPGPAPPAYNSIFSTQSSSPSAPPPQFGNYYAQQPPQQQQPSYYQYPAYQQQQQQQQPPPQQGAYGYPRSPSGSSV